MHGYMMWICYEQNCYPKLWGYGDCNLEFIEFHNTQILGSFSHLNFSILLQISIKPQKSSLEIKP